MTDNLKWCIRQIWETDSCNRDYAVMLGSWYDSSYATMYHAERRRNELQAIVDEEAVGASIESIMDKMREEIAELKGDTMVSMNEGFRNEAVAEKLTEYLIRLERLNEKDDLK